MERKVKKISSICESCLTFYNKCSLIGSTSLRKGVYCSSIKPDRSMDFEWGNKNGSRMH